MFIVNGLPLDGEAGLVQLLDLAQREVVRSFPEAVPDRVPVDLRGGQFRVLSMVPLDGGRRLTDLATIANMTKQAMGEFVAELAAAGCVTVLPDPSDRRAKLVALTPKGREAAEFARTLLGRVEGLWTARIGAEEMETLKALLALLARIDAVR